MGEAEGYWSVGGGEAEVCLVVEVAVGVWVDLGEVAAVGVGVEGEEVKPLDSTIR